MLEFSRRHEADLNLAEIDRQHQNLTRIIQDLQHAVNAKRGNEIIGAVLAEVVTHTIYHFEAEENLMQRHGFPGIEAHRVEHNAMTLKLLHFQQENEAGKPDAAESLLKLLRDWLEEHTLKRDKEYVQFINAKVA